MRLICSLNRQAQDWQGLYDWPATGRAILKQGHLHRWYSEVRKLNLALPISVFLVQRTQGVQGSTSSLRYTIYEDALASGWHARSRASRINLANPSPVYSGSKSIAF